jgi:hypothetical protein
MVNASGRGSGHWHSGDTTLHTTEREPADICSSVRSCWYRVLPPHTERKMHCGRTGRVRLVPWLSTHWHMARVVLPNLRACCEHNTRVAAYRADAHGACSALHCVRTSIVSPHRTKHALALRAPSAGGDVGPLANHYHGGALGVGLLAPRTRVPLEIQRHS